MFGKISKTPLIGYLNKYTMLSHYQNAGLNRNLLVMTANKFSENVAQFKCFGIYGNCIHKEI